MSDPKPTVISCGPFRITVSFCRNNRGETYWRSEIAGCYQSDAFDSEKEAKWHIAHSGLGVMKPLIDELEKLHAKSKNRS